MDFSLSKCKKVDADEIISEISQYNFASSAEKTFL